MVPVATRVRQAYRGSADARRQRQESGRELRRAREDRCLSTRDVGRALGWSHTKILRVEHAESPDVPLLTLNQMAAVVGLDLSLKSYPGGQPLRDAGHSRLLERLHARAHSILRWNTEVPFPMLEINARGMP